MLKKFLIPLLLLVALAAQAQTKKPASTKKPVPPSKKPAATAVKLLKNQNDSLSYAMGISVGQYLQHMGVENINYTLLNKAIDQTLKKSPTYFDMNEANAVMQRSGQMGATRKAAGEKEKGRQFLQGNKKKAGVIETASGLQYEVLVAGNGPKPSLADTVSVHYIGKLLNGKEFDNSYSRGHPLSIGVTGVIPGWTEALQLMPTGSKWRLYIPSGLGYGDYGAGANIPGGTTLVFEVELLDIVNRKAK
jgi:FKBP-type peptidyl-prolyl cis-trans isomerase FklB